MNLSKPLRAVITTVVLVLPLTMASVCVAGGHSPPSRFSDHFRPPVIIIQPPPAFRPPPWLPPIHVFRPGPPGHGFGPPRFGRPDFDRPHFNWPHFNQRREAHAPPRKGDRFDHDKRWREPHRRD